MKLTPAERKAILARLLPKVFAQAARAKEYGIDVVGQPYEHWVFQLELEEAPETISRPRAAQEPQHGQKDNSVYAHRG